MALSNDNLSPQKVDLDPGLPNIFPWLLRPVYIEITLQNEMQFCKIIETTLTFKSIFVM